MPECLRVTRKQRGDSTAGRVDAPLDHQQFCFCPQQSVVGQQTVSRKPQQCLNAVEDAVQSWLSRLPCIRTHEGSKRYCDFARAQGNACAQLPALSRHALQAGPRHGVDSALRCSASAAAHAKVVQRLAGFYPHMRMALKAPRNQNSREAGLSVDLICWQLQHIHSSNCGQLHPGPR